MTRQDYLDKHPQYNSQEWCVQKVGEGLGWWHWRALYIGGTFSERYSIKLSQSYWRK